MVSLFGELKMGGLEVPQSAMEWVGILDTTQAKFVLGLVFFMYALDRPLRLIRRIKEFGSFPFDKRHGVTSNMMCALNGSILLVLLVAVFETIIKGSEVAARIFNTETPLVVAYAYAPLATISGAMALILILAVYWRMVIRYKSQEGQATSFRKRFERVGDSLKARGASNLEVFSLPVVSLAVTVVPWIVPQILAA